ncbi:Phage head-tail joining protein [Gracilibacillus orientalis]|uniref:Phage head-tail joining protein n=1 Tax=Gracilibacillus orientalis TaxID=334253 RepID=A0A1I4Q842_9BACI|nr:Phage head-tail joining protein [Gracilibacillus orientalis]
MNPGDLKQRLTFQKPAGGTNDNGFPITEPIKYKAVWGALKTLRGNQFYAAAAGMRKGEVAALQWSDINFKDKTVTINNTLDFQAISDDELFGDPKTFRSKRTISLTNNTINQLKDHLKWQNKNKQNLNDIYRHDLNLVFCREDGYIMPKSSLFNAYGRILKQAGIRSLPIHSLRHTHAVLQLEAGAEIKFIQERLGHGSYQITADVYSHISKRLDEQAMTKYEEYFNQITGVKND